MLSVRVKRRGVTRREEGKLINYAVGDELSVTEAEYKKLRDKYELLSSRPAKLKDKTPVDDTGEFDVEKASREELDAKAEELGIEVGARWGDRRVRDAIEEALTDPKE